MCSLLPLEIVTFQHQFPPATVQIKNLLNKIESSKDEDFNSIIKELDAVGGRTFKTTRFTSFLHEACSMGAEKVTDFLIKIAPHLLNSYIPGLGRPIELVVKNFSSRNPVFDRLAIQLLQTIQTQDLYKIQKSARLALERPNFRELEEPPVGDQVSVISTTAISEDRIHNIEIPYYQNAILKIAYWGKESIFREILRPYEMDVLPLVTTYCRDLPIDINRIIANYSSMIFKPEMENKVREIVTLTYDIQPPNMSIENEDLSVRYQTPLQQSLHGLLNYCRDRSENHPVRDRVREYIQLAKFILDCGETLDRCPFSMRTTYRISLEEYYKRDLPADFFARLMGAGNRIVLEELTQDVINFL